MKRLVYSMIALSILSLSSCKDDDGDDPGLDTSAITELDAKRYTIALKSDSDGEPEFLVTTDDLMSGEINSSEGIEQIGWRYMLQAGNTIFSSGYIDENICASYSINDNEKLALKSEFIFDNSLTVFGISEDEQTLIGMETVTTGESVNKVSLINTVTGNVSSIQTIPNLYDANTGTVGYPTALLTRGDKLFIPFIKYSEVGDFTNPVSDTAYVAVFSYPNMQFEKYIKDARTGYIGTHGATTGLVRNEFGDLYSFSSTSTVAGLSQADKPSGILKIKTGETDFDTDYFFNVEEATGGDKIFRMHYLGNGKAYARLITDETQGPWETWTAYGRSVQSFTQKSVIIDLESKTITDIANVPLSALRWTAPLLVEDDVFYLSVETLTDAHIYQVDIASATGTKGAKIDGKTVKGIFKL